MINISSRLLAAAIVTLACVSHFSPIEAADSASPRPRAALVIGIADYTAMNRLKNTANDAHDMCDALTALGYTASCFVDVKDSREFKARIQDFTAALKPKSEVVFYYAGHAIQVKGENYLVPAAAKLRAEADIAKETITLNYVMTQLLQGKHYLNIVILDACRGNPWPDSPHGMTAGLAPITTIPRGTMVMYATAPNDSSEESAGRNGILTKNLLTNITSPGLTADELFKRVSEGVQADSAAANGAQTPALYTNFTGEFCFAGCIDKVARAELDRIQKAHEEQLEESRRQRAELEFRKQETQAKLTAAAISMNCDRSVLSDSGHCFLATPQIVVKAIAAAFTQRGFILEDGSVETGRIEAERTIDDPTDKNLSNIVTASATVRNVAAIGRCVVTITASWRTVLHDEYHTWGAISIVPIATSKQYRDVIKSDVQVSDSAFYQGLFAAIERNVRGASAAAAPRPIAAPAPAAAATPIADDSTGSLDHEHRYDAPPDRSERALIETLVSQGYVVRSLNPDFGSINAFRRIQDRKDKGLSTDSVLIASVTTPENGAGSQVQISANDVLVLHREPGGKVMSRLAGDFQAEHGYETRVVHVGAVTDAAFYRGLFAALDADLLGDTPPSKHTQRCAAPADQALRAASEALSQHDFYVSSTDERLGLLVISKRTANPLKTNDGWTANYVNATVYVEGGAANDSVFYVAASSQDTIFRASPTITYSVFLGRRSKSAARRDCRAKQCSLDEIETKFVGPGESGLSLETVTREADADAAVYSQILSIISQKVASAGS